MKEDLKNEERKKKKKRGVFGSRWEMERMKEVSFRIFFFFFFALPIAAFQKVKMQQKVSYSRVFEKRDYRSPKKGGIWEASGFLVGVTYSRVFKKMQL